MIDLIKKYEGCKLFAYKCPMGIWTIGYGNTFYPNGQKVKEGDEIVQDKAEALLTWYVQENIVPVFDKIPYKLTEGQKEALASLIYNIGVPAFTKSKLFTAICNKDWAEAIRQWDFGFKNNLNGLFKRRTEECYLFIKDI